MVDSLGVYYCLMSFMFCYLSRTVSPDEKKHRSDCYLQTNVKKQLEYLLIAWSCIYQGGQMTA